MSEEFKIEIVNPDKSFLSKDNVTEVIVPAFEGEIGILKDHISIISFLKPGIIKIYSKSEEEKFYVEDGIIEFKNNNLSVLTSSIFNLKDLEKNKIQELLKSAEEQTSKNEMNDQTKYLIDQKVTNRNKLFAEGGSAGGLLIGAVVNMEPSLWKGAIAAVPFVDAVTTMADPTIPLTSGEWKEWGDPRIKKYYDYMLSYSPYDQIKDEEHPNLLVTSGFFDSQVQYWEPLKYVAKLRDHWKGSNKLYLNMNMDAGHSGKSGRFRRYREYALEYAFLLDLAGEKK